LNNDLRITCGSGVYIHIIEFDGRLRVMIEAGEDAGHKELRKANSLALEWRDRLLAWQGPFSWTDPKVIS